MLPAFLLGLANGATCLAYCAPAIVPYLLGEGKNVRQNILIVILFLLGRLIGYLVFAVLAWSVNYYVGFANSHSVFTGLVYILLAGILLRYGLGKLTVPCTVNSLGRFIFLRSQGNLLVVPMVMGFLTGLNLCPPFLLAFANAAALPSIGQSILFFTAFFLGTSIYFLPVPLLGLSKNFAQVKIIAKMVAVMMSGYYIYTGIIIMLGGYGKQ